VDPGQLFFHFTGFHRFTPVLNMLGKCGHRQDNHPFGL
jgi:hypothetical protein